MEFFNKVGKIAIGSRLRMLTEKLTEDAARIYALYDIEFQPKWFPVYYVISQGEEKPVTEIAREIGHSHPSVSKIINEMSKAGLITETKDQADGRRNLVKLSSKGQEINSKIQDQYTDLHQAMESISAQSQNDLWKAIEEWEFILEQKSFYERVKELQKERESKKIEIVNFKPEYKEAFIALNKEWISTYFKLEEADQKVLNNPDQSIIQKQGYIFVALYQNEPIGVCALLRNTHADYSFELAKMAVSPKAQGKGAGWLLAQAVIAKAKALGATHLFLESNTSLKSAINLYHKLGFQKIPGTDSAYERCNIQMVLNFSKDV